MPQQVLIVGLGQFGMALTRSLVERGSEVIAVDRRPALVEVAAGYSAEAMVLDGTDQEALARLNPARRDACVCAIGGDSKESSIICTALLWQMGAPSVVARAVDPLHRRILSLVGATMVVNPEEEFGEWFANRLIFRRIVSEAPLGGGLHLSEVIVPDRFVGRTLQELELPRRMGVTVVAVRDGAGDTVRIPRAAESLRADERLLVVSDEAALRRMLEEGQ